MSLIQELIDSAAELCGLDNKDGKLNEFLVVYDLLKRKQEKQTELTNLIKQKEQDLSTISNRLEKCDECGWLINISYWYPNNHKLSCSKRVR